MYVIATDKDPAASPLPQFESMWAFVSSAFIFWFSLFSFATLAIL